VPVIITVARTGRIASKADNPSLPTSPEEIAAAVKEAHGEGVAVDARALGITPLEAARNVDLGPYADLLDAERIVGNLHRASAGLPLGTPLDAAGAVADVVHFCARPMTAHA